MAKLPYMQFYPADYLRDTRCLSLAARGGWIDILCALWNAPKRGRRTLSIEGWAGEIGKGIEETNRVISELRENEIGKISDEPDGKITIMSSRMVREGKKQAVALKRKQKQRLNEVSRRCHALNTSLSQQSHAEESEIRRQRSESDPKEKRSSSEGLREEKIKSGQRRETPLAPAKSSAVWDAYAEAYRVRYLVDPVRNQSVNAQLCKFVDKLGVDAAPPVAAYYLSHNGSWYVQKMHPVNLLLVDAEKLHTEWLTGRQITKAQAEQTDKTAGRLNVFQELIAEKEAAKHERASA